MVKKNNFLFVCLFVSIVLIALALFSLNSQKSSNEKISSITGGAITGNSGIELLFSEENINDTFLSFPKNIIQDQAVLGKPVKWRKQISLNESGPIIVELPKEAENIVVNQPIIKNESITRENKESAKFSVTGQAISNLGEKRTPFKNIFSSITGKATSIDEKAEIIQVKIDDNATDYEIEYETPAPYAIEENTSGGKKVKIIGFEAVHYENVLSFTELDKKLNIKDASKIKIYWVENQTYVQINSVQDRDLDGIYDYIEWTAPHLSNQTFEIIIITKAEHLDSDKNLISNIYEQVKSLDDIWSETISANEYVRVTFETNLTKNNDITLFPRIISGNPTIEVYEKDKTKKIAEFKNINSNKYNKVYLTDLEGIQDTFDLKIKGGSVEFDHIIDPPSRYEYCTSTPDGDTAIYGAEWRAQSFTVGTVGTNENFSITSVKIYARKEGNPGTLTAEIYAASGDDPTGSVLSSGTLAEGSISTSDNWNEINMSSYILRQSTKYVLVFKATSGDNSNYVRWSQKLSNDYAGGIHSWSSDSGSNWNPDSGYDQLFEIWGETDTNPPIITLDPSVPSNTTSTPNPVTISANISDQSNTSSWIDFDRTLLGYWAMDYYNSTVIYDNSTYRYDATLNGAFNYSNPDTGNKGDARRFNGVNDYLRSGLSKSSFAKNITISFFIKPTGAQSTKGVLQFANSLTDASSWILFQRESSNTFSWYLNGVDQITQVGADNVYSYITLTYDGTTWRAYKNGIANGTYVGAVGSNSGNYFWMGNGYNGYFNGSLDEVLVFNRTLSSTEVLALYDSKNNKFNTSSMILANGQHNFTIYAIDAYGNAANSGWRYFNVTGGADFVPGVTLSYPYNNYFNSTHQYVNITFNASVTDDRNLVNCSLWTNYSGTWSLNQTQTIVGITNITNITINYLTNKIFIWNVRCYDNASQSSWGSANRTVKLNYTAADTTPPTYSQVSINNTFNGSITNFSINVNDNVALHNNGGYIFSTNNTWGNATWKNDSFILFTTTPSLADVTKILNSTVGKIIGYRWYFNDSAGNVNSTPIYYLNITAYSDTDPPIITFDPSTPANTSSKSNPITISANISDQSNTSSWIDFDRTLLGYWAMDYYNKTGIYDNSTYNNFGKFSPGTGLNYTNLTTGVRGRALKFDGVNDYIDLGNPSTLNSITYPYTISLWVKPETLAQNTIIMSLDPSGTNSDIAFGFYGSGADEIDLGTPSYTYGLYGISTYLTAGVWQHWVLVFNSLGQIEFYLDGNEITLTDLTGSYYIAGGNIIGSRNTNPNYFFNGSLDEVMVFNKTLSSTEIKALYDSKNNKFNTSSMNLANGQHNYTVYAIDAYGNAANSGWRNFIVGTDSTGPIYSHNSTNNTVAGQITNFAINVSDTFGLDPKGSYIFSTNNTWGNATWKNDSAVLFTTTPSWANVTKILNLTVGKVIGYRWYFNDSAGNRNSTPIYYLNITSNALNCGILNSAGTTYNLTQNVNSAGTCFNLTAQNVTLNCNGYNITGNNTLYTYGVYSNQNKTNITNCNIQNFSTGIYYNAASNGNITNNNITLITSNDDDPTWSSGIILYNNSNYNTVTNNKANSTNGEGIMLYLVSGNNVTLNRAISSTYTGIYLWTASNNTLTNNSGTSNTAYGIYLGTSSNNNILNGNNGTSNSNQGIYLWASSNNILISNNGASNSSVGIRLGTSPNNSLTNNIGTSNISEAVYIDRSSNNTFLNQIARTLANTGANRYAVYMKQSNNTIFRDCVNISGETKDVYYDSATGSVNNTFINCSYNTETVQGAGNELIRKWYYRAYVNDTSGNPIQGATVTAYNTSNSLQLTASTNSSGLIQKQEIIEYVNSAGTISYYSNYTLNATKAGYSVDIHIYNVTLQFNKLNDFFTLYNGSCVYTSGNWVINCSSYCNITMNVNVGGNNISIKGVGTFTTTANISNYLNLHIEGINSTNICRVRCLNGGCFKN